MAAPLFAPKNALASLANVPSTSQTATPTPPDAGVDGATLNAFGSALDGRTPDQTGIQRAIDYLGKSNHPGGTIRIDRGIVLTTASFDLRQNTEVDFGRATVSLQPEGPYAIGIGWDSSSPMVGQATISGRAIQLWGADKTGIAIRNGSGAQVVKLDLDLKSPGQTGLRIAANDYPMGPYYGLVDNIRINGTGAPGQTGIVLEQKYTTGAMCVNRWNFSNIRHIASLETGLDIQGADGLVFNGVNFESCRGRAARFGYASRTVRGKVTRGAGGVGGFTAAAFVRSPVDPSGAIRILTGRNAGESMIVASLDTQTGAVTFPVAFPHVFALGDEFVFSECKCRNISILNATNEGGSPNEVGFEFLAGARDCRVNLAMTTMVEGKYFTREIEDPTNTIARSTQSITYAAALDAQPGVAWLPSNLPHPGGGGEVTLGSCWVDAVYATGESASGGTIEFEVFVDGASQGMLAKLTPDSPYFGRRIRTELLANSLISLNRHVQVRVTKKNTSTPVNVRVQVVLGYM